MSSNLDDSSPARPQDPARSLAPDRSSPARRPDHRDKQVGQARSPATPLLSDGDIMGFNSPGQSTHKPPSLAAASASSISRPGGTVGWLWNLRSEVDNVETVVPKQYPDSLRAQRLSAQTGPGPTCGKRTTRNGGLELAKRATDPRVVLPQRRPSARKVPRSGPTSLPRNDEHPRLGPAPS
jgi:hypothetical protein